MTPWTVAITVAAWIAAVVLGRWIACRWAARGPGGEPVNGLMWLSLRVYCRLMHRPVVEGIEHLPDTNEPGGLIVVSNHTSPVDPLLLQAACRFRIRWMMATDQMIPRLDVLWRWQRVIAVERNGRDMAPAREAIRHVRGGGAIGIFPEGGLALPRGELRPFHNGVGFIVAKTRAPVLLVWISGTPVSGETFRALFIPSRARVVFVERLDLSSERDPAAITALLRERLAEASGWPLNDEPLVPPSGVNAGPFAVI